MCQGCEDYAEYDRIIDAYIAKELPAIIARADHAVETDVLHGRPTR